MRVWPGNQFRIYTPRSRFDLAFRGALPPAGPSIPGAAYGPGANPGETYLTINAPPDVWGDRFVQGDGLGVITGYRTRIAGILAVHDTTVLPITRVSGGHAEGVPVLHEWWALGFDGRPGQAGSALVYPAVTPPVIVTIIGLVDRASGRGLVDRTSGRGFALLPETP